jgi:hypothetical protein
LDQVDKTYVGEIFIYNKKGDTQYRTLPKIGQDPQTFLTHIIENYNNLPDGLVFLQGNPFSNGDNTVLPNNVGDINFFLQELQTRKNTTNYKKGQQDFGLYEGKLQYWNNRRLIDSGTNFYDWFYDWVKKTENDYREILQQELSKTMQVEEKTEKVERGEYIKKRYLLNDEVVIEIRNLTIKKRMLANKIQTNSNRNKRVQI